MTCMFFYALVSKKFQNMFDFMLTTLIVTLNVHCEGQTFICLTIFALQTNQNEHTKSKIRYACVKIIFWKV